jgi:hypothetical protein
MAFLSRHLTGSWRARSVFAIVIVIAWSVALASSASASPRCRVTDALTGQSYTTLQEAVNAASTGDTLKVHGTCEGDTTISKSLTIDGQGQATLDGANDAKNPGVVVVVSEGATVTLSRVIVTGGHAEGGAAISNLGSLTVYRTTVTRNEDATNPDCLHCRNGIIGNSGSLTLNRSIVVDNRARGGGTVFSAIKNDGLLTLDHSSVTANSVEEGILNDSSLTLDDSSVTSNRGGGIENVIASATLNRVTVSHNGGGIYNTSVVDVGGQRPRESSLTLNDSTVSENGGGIGNGLADRLTLNDSTVTKNEASGIYNGGSATLTDSTVTENSGGGIYNEGGTDPKFSQLQGGFLTLNDSSSVSNNKAEYGGGIYNARSGSVTLNDSSSVSNNKAEYGGGIYNARSGSVTLNDSSSVRQNEVTAMDHGGGIYNFEGATLLFGSPFATVTENTPEDIFNEPPGPHFIIRKRQKTARQEFWGFEDVEAEVGQTVQYQIQVIDTGSTTIKFAPLKDAKCKNVEPAGETILEPGHEETFTCEHVLAEPGKYTNVAAIEGADTRSAKVEESNKVEAKAF